MEKTLLSKLKKKLFIRSSLIALGSLEEILGLNDYLSADEILLEIIKKALKEYELSNPLVLEMKVNKNQMQTCYGMPGFYEIKSNFTLYLDCMIGEDQIVMVPQSIPQYRVGDLSAPTPGGYSWVTEYRRPYVYLGDLIDMDQQFYLRGICSRPIIPDWTSDKTFNEDSSKAAIYWLDAEDGGARGAYFVDLCMVHLLDFIRQMKASVTLPSMSIDVFGNVDSAYQELRGRCDQYNLQSSWYGQLLM